MGDLAATDIRRLLSSLRLARACPQPGAAPRGDRRPRRESGLLVPEQPERGAMQAPVGEVERVAPVDVPRGARGERDPALERPARAGSAAIGSRARRGSSGEAARKAPLALERAGRAACWRRGREGSARGRPVGRAPCPPRIRLRSRGAPARLKPRGLLWRKAESVDPSVTHRVRAGPADVPAPEPRLARRAIEREDPLLAVPILEVSDVEVGGLIAEGRRDPARRGVVVVNRQHRL
jgi:hypothetical protein